MSTDNDDSQPSPGTPDPATQAALDAAETRVRALTTLVTAAGHGHPHERLQAPLELLLGGDLAPPPPVDIHLRTSADMREMVWSVSGDAARVDRWRPFFRALDAQISAIPDSLMGQRVGAWLQSGPSGIDAGWLVPDARPLAPVLAALPGREDVMSYELWAQRHSVTSVTRVRRSFAVDGPYVRVLADLPGDNAEAQLMAGLDAFEELQLPKPDMGQLAPLVHAAPERLFLGCNFTADGVSRIGIGGRGASNRLLVILLDAFGNDMENIAALEAILGVKDPAEVEVQLTGEGVRLTVAYVL